VATGRLSGAEKVVSDICTNLNSEFTPVVVCSGEELSNYYMDKGIKSEIIDISKLSIFEIKKLKKLIIKENINLIHAHDVKASIAAYLAGSSLRIPVVSHIHVTYLWMKKLSPLKFIDKYFRNKYNVSLACSELVRDFYLENNNKIDKDKIIFLDNAFNFNEFNKISPRDAKEFKRELNIEGDIFVYGYLGRLLEVKGADLMIDSFYQIQKKLDKVMLLIVGDGPEREKLQSLVDGYGINDKVIFTGYRKNVYDYMNIFNCFILPSVREGLPIAVLEAMAMRKPVITTPVAGLKKLIKNGFNGIMLEQRTKEKLYEAMVDINVNRDLGNSISENAYNYLYEHYHIDRYVRNVENLYRHVISSNSR
jgi:glycosyltransferase involved in cell wall biosynthesis